MAHQHRFFILTFIIILFSSVFFLPVYAAGTVSTCDEASLNTALSGGGVVDFSLSADCTIIFTTTKIISTNTTIQNTSGFTVTFDGNNARGLFFVNNTITLGLDNLTLTRGAGTFTGGAISSNGILNINNTIFSNNYVPGGSAISRGGAIHVNSGTATITNSTFTSNASYLSAPGGDTIGGAISGSGAATISISGSTFTNNHTDGYGGAIYAYAGATLTNNNISNNTATAGVSGVAVANPSTITGNTFVNNTCSGVFVDGGGNTGSNAAGCLPAVALVASATCNGANLDVTISAGDANFNITGSGPGLPRNNVGVGTHTFTGPGSWNVSVSELSFNNQFQYLGFFNCSTPATNTLSVSATCNGNDLVINILSGDANFNITGTGTGLPMNNVGLGSYTFTGNTLWGNIGVAELSGNTESLSIGDIDCTVPVEEIISVFIPTPAVLGCALDTTDGVEVAGAPDNTYCRVLMQNGGVVSYSGAIPSELIGLGVQLAVDIYRLQGGQTVNTFDTYSQICLQGIGRFFYMDGRNMPRYSVEMPSEQHNGMTCAWIPAPGTVILTN